MPPSSQLFMQIISEWHHINLVKTRQQEMKYIKGHFSRRPMSGRDFSSRVLCMRAHLGLLLLFFYPPPTQIFIYLCCPVFRFRDCAWLGEWEKTKFPWHPLEWMKNISKVLGGRHFLFLLFRSHHGRFIMPKNVDDEKVILLIFGENITIRKERKKKMVPSR